MTPLFRKFLGLNWVLVFTILGILVFGVAAIYSASGFRENEYLANSWHRQVIWIIFGLAGFIIVSLVDYRWVRWGAPVLYLAGIGALLVLKAIGEEQSGAVSWIRIGGGMSFQPSQLAILGGILCLAVVLGDLRRVHPIFRYHSLRVLICLMLVGLPMLLVLAEPDVGSASVWGPVLATMLLVGSIPYRYLIVLTLVALIFIPVGYFFMLKPYQKARIETYVKMLQGKPVDVQGDAWVQNHVLTAVGSAGWEGKGWESKRVAGRSMTRLGFIPEKVAINDFIFAVILEEQGYRGGVLVVSVMAFMLFQCLFVAFYSGDELGRLLVVGVSAMLFWHMFMNMGMSSSLTPITGLPLPLVSYGGTFMLTVLFLLGVVQSVWVHRNAETSPAKSAMAV